MEKIENKEIQKKYIKDAKEIKTNKENNTFSIKDTLKIEINGLSEEILKTLEVSLNGNKIEENHILINEKLGVHNLILSYKVQCLNFKIIMVP